MATAKDRRAWSWLAKQSIAERAGIAKVETFIKLKEFAVNSHYPVQRDENLCNLTDEMIDEPILDLINGLNKLPYCFTLQSCYGHFVYNSQKNLHSFDPLPVKETIANVEYRIAYIAFCIENSASGKKLFETFKKFTTIDSENVQFSCAEWFWERQVNSYVLQVEPDRFKHKDKAILDYKEALYIEKLRNEFFIQLDILIRSLIGQHDGIVNSTLLV